MNGTQTGQTAQGTPQAAPFEVPGIPADYVAVAAAFFALGHALALRSVRAAQRPTIVRNP